MNNSRNACVIAMIMLLVCLATAQESVTEATKWVPEYVELDEMTVVGYSSLISMKRDLIPQLWERFSPRSEEVKHVAMPEIYLEVVYDMEKVVKEGEAEDWLFFDLVGRPVSSTEDIPEGMTYKVVPPHKYAKFVHKGPMSKIMETYKYIYEVWLPQSEHEYDYEACEVYWFGERFKMESEDSELDMYVPIK